MERHMTSAACSLGEAAINLSFHPSIGAVSNRKHILAELTRSHSSDSYLISSYCPTSISQSQAYSLNRASRFNSTVAYPFSDTCLDEVAFQPASSPL